MDLGFRFRWYFRNCALPDCIHYTQKCICLFQVRQERRSEAKKIHSVDVLLFTLYVNESLDASTLNRRCVYVSYLDSVNYLTPASFRKRVHQEMVIGYLDYAKRRGFERVYIWACPPLKGDDYVL